MSQVLKLYNSKNVQVTVEIVQGFKVDRYIATVWDKDFTLKADREVYEFETYGGAMDKAFDIMAGFLSIPKYEDLSRKHRGAI